MKKESDDLKVLLTAINAKYIHTSLAIRYLKKYSKEFQNIELKEFTINHQHNYMLQEIYEAKPDVLCVSCYIWNIDIVKELLVDFKKVSPQTKIVLGGPEVSYEPEKLMKEVKEIDMIIRGEGEETFNQLMHHFNQTDQGKELRDIKGICYREGEDVVNTPHQDPLNMDNLPFVYDDFDEFKNKIIYYETTRGCPFNCQYCLSSIEKGVRYRSFDKVKHELQSFLDNRVMQVKFVDRTFNCKKEHAESIWLYLMEHDNGYTNFHFEISADLLQEDTIDKLKDARPGLFQFEIGVQTTNAQTIKHIKRKMDLDSLKDKVAKINAMHNIHQHLDLIAGLPGENYESFGHSFDDVYRMKPEQLQLGFLKVLKGSGLYYDQKEFGLIYRDKAPYEILETDALNYQELLDLKMIEDMVEIYYNSGRFATGLQYILKEFTSPFACFEALANYWKAKGYHHVNHTKLGYYDKLLEFHEDKHGEDEVLRSFLMYDCILYEKPKKLCVWMRDLQNEDYKYAYRKFYQDEDYINMYLPAYTGGTGKQISRQAHMESFSYDIKAFIEEGVVRERKSSILFDYSYKNPVIHNAKTTDVTEIIEKLEETIE